MLLLASSLTGLNAVQFYTVQKEEPLTVTLLLYKRVHGNFTLSYTRNMCILNTLAFDKE